MFTASINQHWSGPLIKLRYDDGITSFTIASSSIRPLPKTDEGEFSIDREHGNIYLSWNKTTFQYIIGTSSKELSGHGITSIRLTPETYQSLRTAISKWNELVYNH